MTSFRADFDLTCRWARLSEAERDGALETALYRSGRPTVRARRIYRVIAGSLSERELAALAPSPGKP